MYLVNVGYSELSERSKISYTIPCIQDTLYHRVRTHGYCQLHLAEDGKAAFLQIYLIGINFIGFF